MIRERLIAVEYKGTFWSDENALHLDSSGDYKLTFVKIHLHFMYILLYASKLYLNKDNLKKQKESLIHGIKQNKSQILYCLKRIQTQKGHPHMILLLIEIRTVVTSGGRWGGNCL